MNELTILSIVGARPQFIKVAALDRAAARKRSGTHLRHKLVHTGQHYDYEMSQGFFDELALPTPDLHLGVGPSSHARQTAQMLVGLEGAIQTLQPHVAVVFGDTNSTLAGALAAAKLGVPVAHVEAGMRAWRPDMPEEINRIIADHVADAHFCSSQTAAANLAREGISESVFVTGDVMHEVLREHLEAADRSTIHERLQIARKGYALATIHRAETTDDASRLIAITRALERLADRLPVVFPVHPRTKKALGEGSVLAGVSAIDPVGYVDMLALERDADVIVTDSGGVQKEAMWLRVPCVTVRRETEWPETLEGGWNVLVDVDAEALIEAAMRHRPTSPPATGLDGIDASSRILDVLCERYEPR